MSKPDKTTVRGVVYSTISGLGFGYEILFVAPPRKFLLVMYGLVILIGGFYIFYLKEPTGDDV